LLIIYLTRMCKIYNRIGSLTTLKFHLHRQNIIDFKSLKEVIDFRNSYPILRKQIILQYETLTEQEKNRLQIDLLQLDTTIADTKLQLEKELNEEIDKLKQQINYSKTSVPTNYIQKLKRFFKERSYKKKIRYKENNLDIKVKKSIDNLIILRREKNNRYQYINSHFDDAVKHKCMLPINELERKKRIIDELNPFISGALGEHKVVKELENLSDEFSLINDFSISFYYPIYNSQENDYIKSIQIDHILISPSGIFLIETKNWSQKSLENLSLRSPVQQIRRTSFVLFKLLNDEITNYQLQLNSHHWGIKKIPIKNLIVLINTKPREELQYVKILTLNELVSYVKYFKPLFSNFETQRITEYLLNINNQNLIVSNRY
jgi:hypothetical protein